MKPMNTAEIKLDLFRQIDKLKDAELEQVYPVFLSLLNPSQKHILTNEERIAVEEALKCSEREETFTHETIMEEAKARFPKLKFG
jgi:glucan phosphorylase